MNNCGYCHTCGKLLEALQLSNYEYCPQCHMVRIYRSHGHRHGTGLAECPVQAIHPEHAPGTRHPAPKATR
jgi:predicted RNA-binding Zn-ribbon protein involved in translation (DUF1610 family)